ncbi:MAG: hypothetical protein M0C28_43020 [Candidatus Moduliflexus flocculans]|nr:hypothetical protein [Candidatus Moduliflexus flocculans]
MVRPAATVGPQSEPPARTRLRENISDLYLIRLTRALDLTEEQTATLYPLLTRAEKEKSALQGRMGADLRELRRELSGTPADEARILALVARIRGGPPGHQGQGGRGRRRSRSQPDHRPEGPLCRFHGRVPEVGGGEPAAGEGSESHY